MEHFGPFFKGIDFHHRAITFERIGDGFKVSCDDTCVYEGQNPQEALQAFNTHKPQARWVVAARIRGSAE